MKPDAFARFEPFAGTFVRRYWEAVKSGAFPMPPDELVEEGIEDLLSKISYTVEIPDRDAGLYLLHMVNDHGDWWRFSFRVSGRRWVLAGASAKSDGDTAHDLLGPVHRGYFAPFLRRVEEAANDAYGP